MGVTETEIWPGANEVDLRFQDLQNLKISRPVGYPLFQEWTNFVDGARLSVEAIPTSPTW